MMMNGNNNDDANGADKEPLSNFPIPILQKSNEQILESYFSF